MNASEQDRSRRSRVQTIERIEAAAWADSYAALARASRDALGAAIEIRRGVTMVRLAALGAPSFNRAIGLGVLEPADFAAAALEGFALPDTMRQWVSALPGRPKWRTYVAFDGDRPVASGAAFHDGGAAWLGFGATLPEARRRGAQRALLARRIADAIEAGCHTLATETGAPDAGGPGPSWRNIHRVGFSVLYLRQNYAPAL